MSGVNSAVAAAMAPVKNMGKASVDNLLQPQLTEEGIRQIVIALVVVLGLVGLGYFIYTRIQIARVHPSPSSQFVAQALAIQRAALTSEGFAGAPDAAGAPDLADVPDLEVEANKVKLQAQEALNTVNASFAQFTTSTVSTPTPSQGKALHGNKPLDSLLRRINPAQQYLVNLQPLTATIGGYIGPVASGVFDPDTYFKAAFAAGIRSFVLPISTYIDDNKTPPNWPLSGKPAIVCRDANGVIQSLNGLSIRKVCESLLTYRNSVNAAQASEPVLLFIDADTKYLPDPVKQEKAYVAITSEIAKELTLLDPYRLTNIGPYGSAVGGVNESVILTQTPLSELNGKILIFTNFNTKIALKSAYSSITPTLDEYTNFTYAPVTTVTAISSSGSKIMSIADISGSTVNWTDQARSVWYTAVHKPYCDLPAIGDVQAALNVGIQAIPIPFFMNPSSTTKAIWSLWNGYAWNIKPEAARFTRPKPVVPATPSKAMNARVSNDLQPGQTSFK